MKGLQLARMVMASTLYVSGVSYADIVIDKVYNGMPFSTTSDGNFEITQTGQVNMNLNFLPNLGNAIVVDSPDAIIAVNASNTQACIPSGTGCAITTSGAGTNGIATITQDDPLTSGNTAIITIGSGTKITAQTNAIYVNAAATTISNSGTLQGINSGIFLDVFGQGAVIENNGVIQNTDTLSAQPALLVSGTSLTLTNANIIKSIATISPQDAIKTTVDFTSITNGSTGQILTSGGTAALEISGNASGAINNSNIIENTAGGSTTGAVVINGAYTGTLTNYSAIQTSSTTNSQAILINASFGTINNSAGTIQATKSGSVAISIEGGSVGTFTNQLDSGIKSVDQPAIRMGNVNPAVFTTLNNGGSIYSGNAMGAVVENTINPVAITNGFYNNGLIYNTVGTEAITLAPFSSITLIQQGNLAAITGNVTLAGLPSSGSVFVPTSCSVCNIAPCTPMSPVLILNGGTIKGNVTAQSTQKNTFNLNAGSITGILTLGTGGDTVNLGGTANINAIKGNIGADIFNINGGNFGDLDAVGTNNIINGCGTATIDGTIEHVQTINVNNTDTQFITNNTIKNLDNALTINAGATYIANGAITGTGDFFIKSTTVMGQRVNGTFAAGSSKVVQLVNGTNDGVLSLAPRGIIDSVNPTSFNIELANQFTQNAGAIYSPGIQGTNLFGTMEVKSAALNLASFIQPRLVTGYFIPANSVFTIMQATSGTIDNAPPVIADNSLTLHFTSQLANANKQLQLVATRLPYTDFVVNDQNAFNIAQVLDQFAIGGLTPDNAIANVLAQLDLITDVNTMTQSIDMLGPQNNYAMVDGANIIMTRTFNSIERRLDQVKGVESVWGERYKIRRPYDDYGFASGDCDGNEVYFGTWAKLLAEYLDAKHVGNIPGYTGNAVGVAVGMDWSMLENSLIGIAGSAMKVNMVDSRTNGNVEDIESYQLTLYGFFQPGFDCVEVKGWYLDGLLAVASDSFKNARNINIGSYKITAHSSFYGLQYGGQLDTGYVSLYDNLYVAPIMRVKWTSLRLDDYTETQADGLDLSVTNRNVDAFLAGVGLRFAVKLGDALLRFYPEMTIVYLYDFLDQGQQTVANFLGGGTAFATFGPNPGRNVILFDLGLTAVSNDRYVFRGKYELEYRNHFLANSGFIELYHRWS